MLRVLTMLGFTFQTRYYCLSRALHEPVEEAVPLADLSLAFRGTPADRTYQFVIDAPSLWRRRGLHPLVPAGRGRCYSERCHHER